MRTQTLALFAFLIAVALSLAAVFLVPVRLHAQAAHFVPADTLAAARACVHEATWAGATTNDCGGIIQVVEARRRDDETFQAALRRTMPRLAAHATDRSWVLGLPAGPLRAAPQGWPFQVGAAHYADAWSAVYHRTLGFMRGLEELPCEQIPIRWFGRVTDGHHLARVLDSGLWREAACGSTRNAFLYAIDPD